MSKIVDEARVAFLNKISKSLDYDSRAEFNKAVSKKYLDYAFSKDFEKTVEDEHYRDLHPALKDLSDQYQEMEALLKKGEKTK